MYRRIAARRGEKRALVALAHAMVIIAYEMLRKDEPYRDLGGNHFDEIKPEKTANGLLRRLQRLGYEVSIRKPVATAH